MLKFIYPFILIVILFAVFIFAPNLVGITVLMFFLLGLGKVIYSAWQRQMKLNQEKSISRVKLMIIIFLELSGFLLVIVLAGIVGRYAAEFVSSSFNILLVKFIVSIMIGLLIGIGIGALGKRIVTG